MVAFYRTQKIRILMIHLHVYNAQVFVGADAYWSKYCAI